MTSYRSRVIFLNAAMEKRWVSCVSLPSHGRQRTRDRMVHKK